MACLNNFMADREIISIRLRTRKDGVGHTNREQAKWGVFPTWLGTGIVSGKSRRTYGLASRAPGGSEMSRQHLKF